MFRVKGINSDTETCECCGKTDLKRVVWIVEIDEDGNETSNLMAYGTTCAAKKLGYSQNNTKAINSRKLNEDRIEYKKQCRKNYLDGCNVIETSNGKILIDKKYRIGLIMREQNLSRDEAIAWASRQMKLENWFLS